VDLVGAHPRTRAQRAMQALAHRNRPLWIGFRHQPILARQSRIKEQHASSSQRPAQRLGPAWFPPRHPE